MSLQRLERGAGARGHSHQRVRPECAGGAASGSLICGAARIDTDALVWTGAVLEHRATPAGTDAALQHALRQVFDGVRPVGRILDTAP